ncbi:leader peptidase (prepilin peptidase)/N-methyltransferase [Desulfobaculum xiamenense]|uniref:Leader peptidase (Prepilin peptidase)/N-methyltransferase n=1 Tax=Desulfobaculum xiamenense TaxID=995050 RepID=A0A846QML7_9BACT|nr:A24 family peptidase [Desulfobaculum xiamenense]NJB68270.1 leader peptidase (prepilin peptidase)/N-methyltransferase [Desulfobaculum xiamenense]
MPQFRPPFNLGPNTELRMDLYLHAFQGLALVLGLCLGSFYNVCIHRTLSGETVTNPPRSKCPKCGHFLAWWENVPLVSYLLLRGRCRQCHLPISPRYPMVEALTGVVALALALRFGPGPQWAVHMAFTGLFIVTSFLAFDTRIMPTRSLLIGAAAALVVAPTLLGVPLRDSLFGVAVGAGLFWVLRLGSARLRSGQWLGVGDMALVALAGALLGVGLLPPVIALGAALAGLAALVGRRGAEESAKAPLPFGPFLCIAITAGILWGHRWLALLG